MRNGPSKWRARLFTVVFMCAVTLVCISVVAAVHLASREQVERNETLYLKRGIMAAAGLDVPADGDAVLAWYDASVTAQSVLYRVRDAESGDDRAIVFVREGAGLWGTIRAVVGVNPLLTQFTGIAFVAQNETPGLGARIMEPWYGEHIKGKTGGLTLVAEKSGSSDPTTLDAITGATITSTAVQDILNTLINEAPMLVQSAGTVQHASGIR